MTDIYSLPHGDFKEDKRPFSLSQYAIRDIEQVQIVFLDEILDTLCQDALRNRETLNFETLFKHSGMNKSQIYKLLRKHMDFHISLKIRVTNHNEHVETLRQK